MVTVRKVETKKDQKKFVKFLAQLYKGNKNFVPPFEQDELNLLNPKKNACFEESDACFFLAERDGKVVGRIAGIISHAYNQKNNEKRARFSRFECIDDPEVAQKLLQTAEDWAREKGMTSIHGPLGFNDLEREGLMIDGFDTIGTYITSWNLPYYQKHIENNGYVPDAKWVEWRINVPQEILPRIERVSNVVEKRYGLYEKQFKNSKEIVDKYGAQFFKLLDECYENIYGTIPFNDKLVKQTLNSFKLIIDKKYVSLIFDKNDQLVAFGVGFPSLAKALNKCKGRYLPFGFIHLLRAINHPKVIDLALIAVKPEYQKLGVTSLIIKNLHSRLIQSKITYCDTGCQLVDNLPAIQALDMFEREEVRHKICYIKQL